MTRHLNPGGTWLGRAARGLWPDHNPLRRRCDRAGAAIAAGLLAAFLVGIPAAAFAAGHWAYASGLQTQRSEEAARHQIHAVLLGNARPARCGAPMAGRWAAPDGTTRTGKITTMTGTLADDTVMVWTGASGRLTGPPLRHAIVVRRALVAAVLAPRHLGAPAAGHRDHGTPDARPAQACRLGDRLAGNRAAMEAQALAPYAKTADQKS